MLDLRKYHLNYSWGAQSWPRQSHDLKNQVDNWSQITYHQPSRPDNAQPSLFPDLSSLKMKTCQIEIFCSNHRKGFSFGHFCSFLTFFSLAKLWGCANHWCLVVAVTWTFYWFVLETDLKCEIIYGWFWVIPSSSRVAGTSLVYDGKAPSFLLWPETKTKC